MWDGGWFMGKLNLIISLKQRIIYWWSYYFKQEDISFFRTFIQQGSPFSVCCWLIIFGSNPSRLVPSFGRSCVLWLTSTWFVQEFPFILLVNFKIIIWVQSFIKHHKILKQLLVFLPSAYQPNFPHCTPTHTRCHHGEVMSFSSTSFLSTSSP